MYSWKISNMEWGVTVWRWRGIRFRMVGKITSKGIVTSKETMPKTSKMQMFLYKGNMMLMRNNAPIVVQRAVMHPLFAWHVKKKWRISKERFYLRTAIEITQQKIFIQVKWIHVSLFVKKKRFKLLIMVIYVYRMKVILFKEINASNSQHAQAVIRLKTVNGLSFKFVY